jgi:hypothetical protein
MAAKKIKRTITLAQRHRDDIDGRQFDYLVVSLQNALEPPIGQILEPEEVAAMIDIGWTVNVKEGKS